VRHGPLSAALALAAIGVSLLWAASSSAYVYWTNTGHQPPGELGTTIGRASNDGSGANQSFITGAAAPCLLAADGSHLYWSNQGLNFGGTTIGRASIDGFAPDESFISGADGPCGVAVDGTYVYWGNTNTTTIGRANLDGSNPVQNFIDGAAQPCGLAIQPPFIYWANAGSFEIGRANLDGNPASVNPAFITLPAMEQPCGVAVDASHIYWANDSATSTTIGRADLDGAPASINQSFINGASQPCGVTTFGGRLYWGNYGSTTIGRANLDGTGVDQSFIGGADHPCGPVIDSLPAPAPKPSNAFTFTRVARNMKRGGARLTIGVPGAGTLQLSGTDLETKGATVPGPKDRSLRVFARDPTRRMLKSRGRVKVTAKVTFTPNAGDPATRLKKITLRKRR